MWGAAMTNVVEIPALYKVAEKPKDEPIMSFVGEGKYQYVSLKEGDIEVLHRLPLVFHYLEGEKRLEMVKDLCGELRRKLVRAKRAKGMR